MWKYHTNPSGIARLSLTGSEFERNLLCQSSLRVQSLRDTVKNHLKDTPVGHSQRYLWALPAAYAVCGQSTRVQPKETGAQVGMINLYNPQLPVGLSLSWDKTRNIFSINILSLSQVLARK